MKKMRLGTRGSPLALKQTEMVRAALAAAWPDIETEVVVIKTSGDWTPAQGETPLPEDKGGKALFAKEIEEALLAGRIDAGVHSMKDMDSRLPEGLTIAAVLAREDARDCLIFRNKETMGLADMPLGFVIGTCSVRRRAFLLARRPDLKIVSLRGNVETRLEKLQNGMQGMQAILLARAGLNRLGIAPSPCLDLDVSSMPPCGGQGVVGIEARSGDREVLSIFGQINHEKTMLEVSAERAVLKALGASCRSPVGVYSRSQGGYLSLNAQVALPDGRAVFYESWKGPVKSPGAAEAGGMALAEKLCAAIPPALFREIAG